MSAPATAWTAQTLQAALQDLPKEHGISAAIGSENPDVVEVTLEDAGGFVLYVTCADSQILTTAILWPRDEQDDPAGFEAMMLRSHKVLLPLCALSIDEVDGREYYELFGSMAQGSDIDTLLEEFQTIADNALELAAEIGPGAAAAAE